MLKRTLILLICLLTALGSAQAATLTVRGDGAVSIKADRAEVVIGVRNRAEDAIQAQQGVNERIQAICDALLAMGIQRKDISTNAISLYPNTVWGDNGEDRIEGYDASNTLCIVTTDMEGVGGIVDAAFSAGANELQYVRFTAAETGDAFDEALKLAVEDALHKAELIAEASGLELGELLSIDEAGETGFSNSASIRSKALMEEDPDADTMVSAGMQQVTASVTLQIEAD